MKLCNTLQPFEGAAVDANSFSAAPFRHKASFTSHRDNQFPTYKPNLLKIS